MSVTAPPIAILSFNRPDHLKQVLDSLLAQRDGLGDRPVALFQDGSFSPTLQQHHDDPDVMSECVRLFRERFPRGSVFESEVNLGIALNYERAARYVFEKLGAPAGMFFEDDLVLGPVYITVLQRLIELAVADERIGYVAAFGNFQATEEEQQAAPRKLRPLHLLWGFGLTRRHWLKFRRYLKPYLEIVRRGDYRRRDHEAIRALCARWGVQPGDTGQDRINSFATALVGAVKLNTEVAYAQYIGESGLNFTPELFEAWGFHDHRYVDEVLSLDFDLSAVNFDPWAAENNVWPLEPEAARSPVKRLWGWLRQGQDR